MKEKTRDGFVGQLRSRLKASMKVCPTCGTAAMSQREVAHAAGIETASLCRFLAGKGGPSAALVDKVVEYLGDEGATLDRGVAKKGRRA